MSDYISREQAVRSARFIYDSDSQLKALTMMRMLRELPSVTPTERTGHWIDTGSGQECSECHEIQYGYDSYRKYCANCGAKMMPQERSDKE